MGVIAAAVRELLAVGISGEDLAAAVERMEDAAIVLDEQAERRRARDRERKRMYRLRNSAESADIADAASPDKERSPIPPKEINPQPSLRSVHSPRANDDAEFGEFWSLYPNKVGKPKAKTSFATARRRSDFEPIMEGLRRYIRTKPPDREWMNPATFLNQERWNDEPASAASRQPRPTRQSILEGVAIAAAKRLGEHQREASLDERVFGDGRAGPPDRGRDFTIEGELAPRS